MKRNYLLIAAAAVMFAACSQTDTLKENYGDNKDQKPFSFSAYSYKATKADNHSTLQFFYPTFNVYGWKSVDGNTWVTDVPVFNNVTNEYFASTENYGTVIYKEADGIKPNSEWTTFTTGWFYQGVRYFDKFYPHYQFCAYAPIEASNDVTCTPDGVIKIGASDESKQITVDPKNLMANPATALAYTGFNYDYMTATSDATTSDVNLTFSHKLAKFNIKIELAKTSGANPAIKLVTNDAVKIDEISLHKINGKGYYDSSKESTSGFVSGWATSSNEATYQLTNLDIKAANDNTYHLDGYYIMERLMIPQTVSVVAAADKAKVTAYDNDAYIYIDYSIGNQHYKGYYALGNLFLPTTTTETSYNFQGGNEYTLTVTIGPDPIHFAAAVTPWHENTGSLEQ